ncbi:MAG: 16S rRNA (cytosine(1402)-N(4))-methyltransferase RsmH [Acidimicrobiia bacterium]
MNDDPVTGRDFHHSPVMGSEIVRLFADVPAGVIVDATLGGGGHAALLLAARPDCSLLGLDRDPAALTAAGANLAPFGDRVTLRHARFDRLATVMTDLRLPPVSGVLFDLGVSSPQLDRAERGFSYRNEGPLDMRMDPTEPWSAADVVNGYSVEELTRILLDHADERFANRIARAIVAARPIESTAELAAVVRDAIPAPARRRGGHPAKRTFQAIRIEVNRELEVLAPAIEAAIDATAPGGRIAVLAYHSGEDRIVKATFRQAATGGCECPPGLPCACGAVRTVRLVRPGAAKPSKAEIETNPRAESARLRAAEKLATAPERQD